MYSGLTQVKEQFLKEQGLEPFDKNFIFYFDETNNFRKFLLKPSNETKVNKEECLNADFILGGVCFKNVPDCEGLFEFYENQGIIGELKSKHLFKHNNFLYDFKGERVSALLKWFEENENVYIHYAIENNLYFALVDIVDSILDNYLHMFKYHLALKDALYRVCKLYQNRTLDLLCDYEYPNVSKDNLKKFARKLSDFIDEADIRDDFYAESLRQMLKSVKEKTAMPFIVDNKPFQLQDSYSIIYYHRIVNFKESILYFDEEKEVIEELKKVNFLSEFPKCSFKNSISERFIQISDCIIACLSRTFQYLDSIENNDIDCMEVEDEFKNNLRRLQSLIHRSDQKNKLLIFNLNAYSLTQGRQEKLNLLCAK
jgi:hypothetical protein